jgi:hypothetical protein
MASASSQGQLCLVRRNVRIASGHCAGDFLVKTRPGIGVERAGPAALWQFVECRYRLRRGEPNGRGSRHTDVGNCSQPAER